MKPSKGALRPSVLAMNPHNAEASIARREKLIAAFAELSPDEQADFIEAAESWARRQSTGVDFERDEARSILRKLYDEADLS